MEFLKKVNAWILGLAVLLTVSCKKDDPLPNHNVTNTTIESNCKLLFIGGIDTLYGDRYNYDINGKLIGINKYQRFETLDYDGLDRIIRNNLYSLDSVLSGYFTYHYNGNGQLIKLKSFLLRSPGTLVEEDNITFVYNPNGELIERNHFSSPQSALPFYSLKYLRKPNGDVEIKFYLDANVSGNPQLDRIENYSFDNKKGFYSGISNIINYNFLPTEHNVVAIKVYDKSYNLYSESTFSYNYNQEGYPITITTYNNGVLQANGILTYNCQ